MLRLHFYIKLHGSQSDTWKMMKPRIRQSLHDLRICISSSACDVEIKASIRSFELSFQRSNLFYFNNSSSLGAGYLPGVQSNHLLVACDSEALLQCLRDRRTSSRLTPAVCCDNYSLHKIGISCWLVGRSVGWCRTYFLPELCSCPNLVLQNQ